MMMPATPRSQSKKVSLFLVPLDSMRLVFA